MTRIEDSLGPWPIDDHPCSYIARGKRAVPMGGAINRSLISAHFLLSAYFLTVQTYKRMRLITRVYGNLSIHNFSGPYFCSL